LSRVSPSDPAMCLPTYSSRNSPGSICFVAITPKPNKLGINKCKLSMRKDS